MKLRTSNAMVSNGLLILGAGFALFNSSTLALSAGFEILKPHRAIYEIQLEKSTERSGIDNMNGRIVYEMQGNECDGMSVRYRFVSKVNANGDVFTTDQQTASYEAPDGKEYNFLTKSFVDDRLESTVKGVATRKNNTVEVILDSPESKIVDLPKASFISSHLVSVIEKARQGVPFFKMDVFDGGDDADKILKTTNVIGHPQSHPEVFPGEKKDALKTIAKEKSWPVTIGYFEEKASNSTESLPVYEVSFLLYEGGISRKLIMRYPDYSIKGTLVALEMLDNTACQIKN